MGRALGETGDEVRGNERQGASVGGEPAELRLLRPISDPAWQCHIL